MLLAYIQKNNALISLIENLLDHIYERDKMHQISSLTFAEGTRRGTAHCVVFCNVNLRLMLSLMVLRRKLYIRIF